MEHVPSKTTSRKVALGIKNFDKYRRLFYEMYRVIYGFVKMLNHEQKCSY